MSLPDDAPAGVEGSTEDDKLPFTFMLTIGMAALYVIDRVGQVLWRLGEWLLG